MAPPRPPADSKRPAGLPAELFARQDEQDDRLFYDLPRFVAHIDDAKIASLTEAYRQLPAAGTAEG